MAMVPLSTRSYKNKEVNRGSWTAEEDQRLAQVIEVHGPRKWKSVATKAGLVFISLSLSFQDMMMNVEGFNFVVCDCRSKPMWEELQTEMDELS